MATYKSVNGFIKSMRHMAYNQDIEQLKGFKKLSQKQKSMLYFFIADIQNDVGEFDKITQECLTNKELKQ